MTWAEFKKLMEERGVQDNDELEFIDTTLFDVQVERVRGDDDIWYVSVS